MTCSIGDNTAEIRIVSLFYNATKFTAVISFGWLDIDNIASRRGPEFLQRSHALEVRLKCIIDEMRTNTTRNNTILQ